MVVIIGQAVDGSFSAFYFVCMNYERRYYIFLSGRISTTKKVSKF